MAKQIIISQGDYGFCFNVKLVSEDNKPVPLGSDKVTFYVIKPSGAKELVDDDKITIVDNKSGEIEFIIDKKHTDEVGNYSCYIEISNSDFEVNTVNAINYYVINKHGGA